MRPFSGAPDQGPWYIRSDEKQGDYCMSSDNYGTLGENMQENWKGAAQCKDVIQFYRDCIAEAQRLAKEESDDL